MNQTLDAINKVHAELAQIGIAKVRENADQHYKFRGIDEVYSTIAPLLAKHRLIIVPRIINRVCTPRTTRNGGYLADVCVEAEFVLMHPEETTQPISITTYGEAMDTADKATNKAISAAHKYAILMLFTVPTVGENDADERTPAPGRDFSEDPAILAIKAAATEDAVKKAFDEPYAAAKKARDRQKGRALIDAVNARLAELKGPAE